MSYATEISSDPLRASFWLKKSMPVAFPTETVYGLGAGVFDEEGIQKIFVLKKRPSDNPLIVHLASLEMLPLVAEEVPEDFYTLASHFMPGPLTIIVKKNKKVPSLVSCGLPTIGVRIPSHPVAKALLEAYGMPIAAPSANLSGKPSATEALHVLQDFEGKIPLILENPSSLIGIESTVVQLFEDHVLLLRPGIITASEIEKVLSKKVFVKTSSLTQIPEAPGMKYRHYAPKAPLFLFESLQALEEHCQKENKKRLYLASASFQPQKRGWEELTEQGFYHTLRKADEQEVEEILVLFDEKLKEGLKNRLFKAAGF